MMESFAAREAEQGVQGRPAEFSAQYNAEETTKNSGIPDKSLELEKNL